MPEEKLNFNDVLNVLDTFTKDLSIFEVWVPSLQKTVNMKELTAKQQKQLLSFVIDSTTGYKSFFAKPFYDILIQNCGLSKPEINKLTFIDYTSMAIAIRKQISDTLKVEFETETENKVEDINLASILENFKNLNYPKPEKIIAQKETLKIDITVKIPTILDDVLYFEYMPVIKQGDAQVEALKQLVAEAYIYETSKCIEQITINDKSLGYNELGIKQRYALLEKLPATVIQKILSQYASWRELINKSLTVYSSSGIKKTLEIDTLLFLTT